MADNFKQISFADSQATVHKEERECLHEQDAVSEKGLMTFFEEEEEEEDEDECDGDDDDNTDTGDDRSWIDWFCNIKGHEYFVKVDYDFIRDEFNLTGLSSIVPHYDCALDLILDNESEDIDELCQKTVEDSALLLYGMIHSRFILTNQGLNLMREKYTKNTYGKCCNTYCNGQPVLPIGMYDIPMQDYAKVFCPKCNEVFHPPKSSCLGSIDGAYFGRTFPHLFIMQYEPMISPPTQYYIPRIYGFKVHKYIKDSLRATGNRIKSSLSA